MSERVVLVTGALAGIGRATATAWPRLPRRRRTPSLPLSKLSRVSKTTSVLTTSPDLRDPRSGRWGAPTVVHARPRLVDI